MYIAPNSIIRVLKNVRLDNTYQHTIYFVDEKSQTNYFIGKTKQVFDKYTYLRKEARIRLDVCADSLFDCNYIMFQNTSYGNKWFYAFINNIEYVNNMCCNIAYEIDVMQTWHFNYTVLPSFIEREHSLTDIIGENLVPENLETGEYKFKDLGVSSLFSLNSIVVASTFDSNGNYADGGFYGGVYSGLHYNVFNSAESVNNFLEKETIRNNADGIVSIFMMPTAFVATETQDYPQELTNIVRDKNYPSSIHYEGLDGYNPRNKKLLTYPYNMLYVTNNEGECANLPFEYFSGNSCEFKIRGVMCCTPEVMCVPLNYKGVEVNYNEKMILTNFPQCAYTIDSFKAYLAQNASRLGVAVGTSMGVIATSLAPTVIASSIIPSGVGSVGSLPQLPSSTGGLNNVVDQIGISNPSGAIAGATGLATTLATIADKSTLPPHARGSQSSFINFAERIKGFQFMYAFIRREFAEIIDNYFSMYGYATHKVKLPNRSGRPHWNYVQTVDVNIVVKTGTGLPVNALKNIKSIYNRGVTFWRNGDEIGDYHLDNSIPNEGVE